MSGVNVQVKVDAARATEEFKLARKDINARTKDGLARAGQRVVLPEAKRFAPSKSGRLRGSLVVKTTTRQGYITTNLRGKAGRYVGLQEYGGTVRTPILHKRAKALHFGDRFTASVKTERHYKAKRFMTRAVSGRQSAIADAIADELMRAFEGFAR